MLRRLDLEGSYRSLTAGCWPATMPLGRRSVTYGHNGSGKSSFASLLLDVASDATPTHVVWEDEHGQQHKVRPGQGGPSPSMAVFTKEWVRRNLSQFLDGNTASPVVTLGEETTKAKRLAKAALEAIAEHLREFDYDRFSKHRFSMPTVEGRLRACEGGFPDENKSADALKRLGGGAAERVTDVTARPQASPFGAQPVRPAR